MSLLRMRMRDRLMWTQLRLRKDTDLVTLGSSQPTPALLPPLFQSWVFWSTGTLYASQWGFRPVAAGLAMAPSTPGQRRDSSRGDPSEVTSNGSLLTSCFSYMVFNTGLQHLLNVYVPSPVLGALPMNDSRRRYD